MGCMVEKTDTGVEVDVHVFDGLDGYAVAANYVITGRGYRFDRHEHWAGTTGFDFFVGPNPGERASVRPHGMTWRACFWIEGDIKVERVGAFEGKPTWNGLYRLAGHWYTVTNALGLAIAYASPEAAHAGAQFSLDEVNRNTVRSA